MKTIVSKPVWLRLALLVASFGILFLFLSCEKKELVHGPARCGLNATEEKLVGVWTLRRTELYEIVGLDSAGQLNCVLVGQGAPDSCEMDLKGEFADEAAHRLRGAGAPETCSQELAFTWQAPGAAQLQIDSVAYQLCWLGADSLALQRVYVSDVLKLKSVAYYKRK